MERCNDAHLTQAGLMPCTFIHIPGPNPILTPGQPGTWDDGVIESCDILKDHDTYWLYYHGTSSRTGYQIGVATAPHPLGPWEKRGTAPVLALGPEGSWDERGVACAAIIKEGLDRYYMWYSGLAEDQGARWGIGLATADNPLGPWHKHRGNPILPDCGYVGGVVKVGGKYHMYCEHPIGSTGADYGPISLAVADAPEGSWLRHEGGPVLTQGEWGQWDDGGFSEAKVVRSGDVYHLFYGGAKLHPTRILSRESIGYAWSLDGLRFHKHPANPVAPREANPDAAAFAEVHAYHETPFWYLYHTLRYNSRDGDEDIGVEVLAEGRPFRLSMPVLSAQALAPGAATELGDCRTICLSATNGCSLTVQCTFPPQRVALRISVFGSHDGLAWDTEELSRAVMTQSDGPRQMTLDVITGAPYARVVVANDDPAGTVGPLCVHATLAG